MSEKYFNAYVDTAISFTHELVTTTIQLKAQLRVLNDAISEKDSTITSLQNELNAVRNQNSEMDSLRSNAKKWEDSYNSMVNKVSHMETLTNQYNSLKQDFINKCNELEKANAKIEELDNLLKAPVSKKTLNNKSGLTLPTKPKETNVDDF